MITISDRTTKDPITCIGEFAGICWGADVSNKEKNYKRGKTCLNDGHGRTFEFPSLYMIIDAYSARVIREYYTHIGGMPTRLQESTRYIDEGNFDFIIPPSINKNDSAYAVYETVMLNIQKGYKTLQDMGISKEDIANILPLGMETKIVVKTNPRALIDMSHQRECSRAYWEFRKLMAELEEKLSEYSEEWKELVNSYCMPKCEYLGYCPESKGCGRKPPRLI